MTRRARLAPAPPVPDLTAAVLAALPPRLPGGAAAARARLATSALRLALLAVGAAQALLAWPALVSGTAAMSAPVHMAHETGAWNLAAGAAFVAVAVAPRLAAGALPFLGTFAVLLTVLTARDLAAGHVHADRAVAHLLLLAGVALVGGDGVARAAGAPVPALGRTSGCPRERRPRTGRPAPPAAVLLLLLAGWLLAGVVTAGPAAAHAELVGTDPGEGARLSGGPRPGVAGVQRGRLGRAPATCGSWTPRASASTPATRRSTAAP